MHSVDKSIVTEWIIGKLRFIPFPYGKTLISQICAAEMCFREYEGYCCITFAVPDNIPQLPLWLDTVPLSWQINIDGVPTLCQFFVDNGCIEKIEVTDMGFEKIKWRKIFEGTVSVDQEFEEQNIRSLLSNREICIKKAHGQKHFVDWMLTINNKSVLACFRDCSIRRLELCEFPVENIISIKTAVETGYKYTVCSNDGRVDFDCSFLFLRWNAAIG